MKHFIFLSIFFCIFFIPCQKENGSFKTKNKNPELPQNSILGEDLDEINAFVKNIYSKNKITYVEIDVVQITYKNIDERVLINKNPKIRTYIVDKNTLIYTDDCKEINPSELIKIKNKLLNDKSLIVVGKSENGKMINLNFGCYG